MMEVCRSSYRQNLFLDPIALHLVTRLKPGNFRHPACPGSTCKLMIVKAVISFQNMYGTQFIVFFKSAYVPIASWKFYTIPIENVIIQFVVVEHFLWVMFACFVIDYGLNTIFEAF